MSTTKCPTCKRGPSYVQGCSHTACPNRKTITAQAIGEPDWTPPVGAELFAMNGGMRRAPTQKDED